METPVIKTPVLQDKRLWLSIATILAVLASSFLGWQIAPESLAAVIMTVVGYVTSSAAKEAAVAKAVAAAGGASAASSDTKSAADLVNK